MFKLLFPNGKFSNGKTPEHSKYYTDKANNYVNNGVIFFTSEFGKIWKREKELKRYIETLEHYDYSLHRFILDKDKIEDSIIIEYEIVEKKRYTVKEFMEKNND